MRKKERQLIKGYTRQYRRRSLWRKLVQMAACVVVFCTTYALILPAITMEQSYSCGLEPHAHTEDCYTRTEQVRFGCAPSADVLHTHEMLCYDSQGTLICPHTQRTAHIHEPECYQEGTLVCPLEEVRLHVHTDSCLDETGSYSCGLPQITCHVHTEQCLIRQEEQVLTCGLEVHAHGEDCRSSEIPVTETGEAAEMTETTEITEITETTETAESTESTEVTDSTEAAESTGETEPAQQAPERLSQTAETENYTVTVSWPADLVLPQGAQLQVVEYARDSEIFRQRCQEAGYELDWLLNIGFFLDGQELELSGDFAVTVTAKQGQSLGTDITHFAQEGNDRITGTADAGEGQNTVEFNAEGFSDFGGGVALADTDARAVDTSYPRYPNYPHAIHTGTVNINRLRFYNLCEGNGGIAALPGCSFRITGDNGYTATVVSGDDPEINLPAGIPDGNYVIEEISVPEGYLRDTRYRREFQIRNGNLTSEHNIGTFINHNVDRLTYGKTGEVEDYNNRLYQILLSAESNLRLYEMEPIHVLFVVDRSNSMLFPSGMVDTGYDITLRLNGSGNISNNRAVFDALDKSQVYYVVADPEGSATAWAIWYNGNTWMCQDSSYYAKAKHNNTAGYQTPGELAIFPTDADYSAQPTTSNGQKARSNGAGLSRNLAGSSLGKHIDSANGDVRTYNLYTAKDQYNRLHYLEEALANIIYALADANHENKITLVPFTKTVETTITNPNNGQNIPMPVTLTTSNAEMLVDVITNIDTSGGTRQDLALEYTYNTYLRNGAAGTDKNHTYTILITDGAPVESDDKTLTQIYSDIRKFGGQVKNRSTLMSVALGMDTVVGGSQALKDIASSDRFYCALQDASELIDTMQDVLFEGFTMKQRLRMTGELTDEISDSFYPVAWTNSGQGSGTGRQVLVSGEKDWILLQSGDWITREGKYTTSGAWNAAGQLLRREDGTFFIQWKNLPLSNEGGWKGTFYVKAKEDFIGGNAIDTNKSAQLVTTAVDDLHPSITVSMDTPTVNVHLLDMNQMESEVTVYLGDRINGMGSSPLDSIRLFYGDTRVQKILSGSGDVLNRYDTAEGLEDGQFTLKYAMGRDLTQEEWTTLLGGGSVTVPYCYDNDSSHGNVGEFTFRLSMTGIEGASPGWEIHEATAACQPNGQPLTGSCTNCAESYVLHISYKAYGLGEQGRPAGNVNNGTGSPGTEVGTGYTLASGLGTVQKQNVHKVHVISGAVRILKELAEGTASQEDMTFRFLLHRNEDGADTSRDAVKTITVPAGSLTGSGAITFEGLRRGTYTVTELEHETYMVSGIAVTDRTNCYSQSTADASGHSLTFVMGSNTANGNVIGQAAPSHRYTSYIDPVNGVFGEAVFSNAPIVYYGDIPVEKIWDDGAQLHGTDTVYVVLYLAGEPVTDEAGNGRILKLDASNGWKGAFRVILASKEDRVTNYEYSVREAAQVSGESIYQGSWHSALLENDGQSLLFYDRTLDADAILAVQGKAYMVAYSQGPQGQWTVTNRRGVELPMTGGMGTHWYTTGGALLMAAALVLGCSQRRKRERRAST